jgi:hypothetical protein
VVPGTSEDFRCADHFHSKTMANLIAVGRDALELQQSHQRFEPWISP